MDPRERQMRAFLFWIVAAVVMGYTLLTDTSILLGVGVVVSLRLAFVYATGRGAEQPGEENGRVRR